MEDVTTGQVMFNYYQGWVFDDRWVEYKYRQGAVRWLGDMQSTRGLIDVDFTPGDLYSLYLFAHTQNNDDISSTFCNLTNLQVPEPSTMPPSWLWIVWACWIQEKV